MRTRVRGLRIGPLFDANGESRRMRSPIGYGPLPRRTVSKKLLLVFLTRASPVEKKNTTGEKPTQSRYLDCSMFSSLLPVVCRSCADACDGSGGRHDQRHHEMGSLPFSINETDGSCPKRESELGMSGHAPRLSCWRKEMLLAETHGRTASTFEYLIGVRFALSK